LHPNSLNEKLPFNPREYIDGVESDRIRVKKDAASGSCDYRPINCQHVVICFRVAEETEFEARGNTTSYAHCYHMRKKTITIMSEPPWTPNNLQWRGENGSLERIVRYTQGKIERPHLAQGGYPRLRAQD